MIRDGETWIEVKRGRDNSSEAHEDAGSAREIEIEREREEETEIVRER